MIRLKGSSKVKKYEMRVSRKREMLQIPLKKTAENIEAG
jgi:hypothetical protein